MPAPAQTKKTQPKTQSQPAAPENSPAEETRTLVGWQGIRCSLPPEWNVTGFSMERESGYLRIDSPGSGTMTVQIRWTNAARPDEGPPSGYTLLAPYVRKLFRRPPPPIPKPDLKSNLEKMLKETERQAKKAKTPFESTIKPERTEGENDERTAMNFSWSGVGRGQGKIWHCATCQRIVIAQVVGMAKDHHAISVVASRLFSSLQDHSETGYDLWALYDLQVEVPEDFRLEEQKLLSGYLNLTFGRGGEKIVVDRWGLANMTLKKFSVAEWFQNHALVHLKRLPEEETEIQNHAVRRYSGPLSLLARIRALRDAKTSLRRFPTRYEGGAWECRESNKIFALQVLHSKRTEGLWEEVAKRCLCHLPHPRLYGSSATSAAENTPLSESERGAV
jgi:hypothetical protein